MSQTLKVVGRSGQVMDLPEIIAGGMLRNGSVRLVDAQPAQQPSEPKPRRRRKPACGGGEADEQD